MRQSKKHSFWNHSAFLEMKDLVKSNHTSGNYEVDLIFIGTSYMLDKGLAFSQR